MASAIIYIRVSSQDQVTGTSLDSQEAACREYCRREGFEVAEVFREEGESAKTADRPELLRALDAAKGNKIAAFVVWKLDRLSRSQHDAHILRASLAGHGVRVVSVTEPLDENPVGRFLFGILSAAAQLDNDIRAERCKAGMTARARAGWWVWRAPIGYRTHRTPDGPSLAVDETTGPLIRRAFEMAAKGESQASIIADLAGCNVNLSPQALSRLLRNPVYAGILRSCLVGQEPIKGRWPALVPPDLWGRAQDRLGRSTRSRQEKRANFPLRGWILCDSCGRPLTGGWCRGRHGGQWRYYFCPRCRGRTIRAERLEEAIEEIVSGIAVPTWILNLWRHFIREAWEGEGKKARDEHLARRRRVDQLTGAQGRLLDAYLAGHVSQKIFEAKSREIENKLLQARIEEQGAAGDELDIEAAIAAACRLLGDPIRYWHKFTQDQRARLWTLFFKEPIRWDGKNLLNPPKSAALKALTPEGRCPSHLVTHWKASLNPFLVFLRGALALAG